ncbi:Gfo/Idh/MocA family protein [Microbacterium algeriense]|uniref:Gfo/Idh/MocA family protein n=1 Tax=Microbacterium algeriense TaxID=2615184 RepID=UPI0022E03FCC|nr:Gfo/Idh/MocA family oxidoreductase [Microbacterium algeriense]
MPPRNVAIVGLESSHAEEIIRHLNVDAAADASVRVQALVAHPDAERTRFLAALGGIDRIVDDPAELRGEVDGVVVTSRDGAQHRAQAVPFLEAGTPVWVDKPLATSAVDAREIVAAAERGGAALTSSSTLRWSAEMAAAADGVSRIGALQSVRVTGPADAGHPHGGLFFYGIHVADLAQRLLPGEPEHVAVDALPDGVVATYRLRGVPVSLELIRPTATTQVPFHVAAVGREGIVSRDIAVGPGYMKPAVDAFVDMLVSGRQPLSAAEMLAPIVVLERIAAELPQAH